MLAGVLFRNRSGLLLSQSPGGEIPRCQFSVCNKVWERQRGDLDDVELKGQSEKPNFVWPWTPTTKVSPTVPWKRASPRRDWGHASARQAVKLSIESEKPYEVVAAGKQFAETSADGRGSSSLQLRLLNAWTSPRKTEAWASLRMQGGNRHPSHHSDSHSRRARPASISFSLWAGSPCQMKRGHQALVSDVLSMACLCALTRHGALSPLPRTPRMATCTCSHKAVSMNTSKLAGRHRSLPQNLSVTCFWICLSITRTKTVAPSPFLLNRATQHAKGSVDRTSIEGSTCRLQEVMRRDLTVC